jgi:hypothetical protein
MGSAPRSGRASWPFADGTLELAEPAAFHRLLDDVRATDWVVYAKRPFAGPEQVLAYLGRYTHRIAIANDRLLSLEDGRVRFRWKDYADHDRPKVMSLAVEEFLRRFLLHVLPAGFWRMRHFGLLANRRKRQALARCREILAHPTPAPATEDSLAALVLRLTGLDILQCPICRRGRMLITRVLPRVPAPPPPPDTS